MIDHLLTDKELELVFEVLQAESKRLSVDERRADTHAMKKDLRERQRAVDRITERLQEIRAGDYKVQ